jgi:hypothetical protein
MIDQGPSPSLPPYHCGKLRARRPSGIVIRAKKAAGTCGRMLKIVKERGKHTKGLVILGPCRNGPQLDLVFYSNFSAR